MIGRATQVQTHLMVFAIAVHQKYFINFNLLANLMLRSKVFVFFILFSVFLKILLNMKGTTNKIY